MGACTKAQAKAFTRIGERKQSNRIGELYISEAARKRKLNKKIE